MKKLTNTAEMREIDRVTVEEIGIPETILMEHAGLAIVDAIRSRYPDLTNLKVSVFAGKGNNGGDGSVAARLLRNLGANPTLFLLAKRDELKGDARLNADIFVSIGGALKEITQPRHLGNFKLKFMHSTVVVDALLGTGLKSEPQGLYGDIVDLMNKYGEYKVAVDIPTGINADNGSIFGKHFVADVTACLGARKLGLCMSPAREAAGSVRFYDISIPGQVVDDSPCATWLIEDDDIRGLMPGRPADGHKGVFGHLALACGSSGMGGAAALAGMGALRIGAGLVTACLPQGLAQAFEVGCKEVMTVSLDSTEAGSIAATSADRFIEFARDKTAILIGPGL
ncbi:NAD(P)H-hydrate epimerase / ADP-dependent (S)-NAD(P)H-hydrate dehydratase, partial [hydrothermal vent metagenome]